MPSLQSTDTALEHAIAALVLLGRLGDIGSTYLITPNLTLEANPLVRRWRWRFALSSLLLCAVPYFHVGAGLAIAIASLMVTASNLSRGWVARGLGEEKMLEVLQIAASGLPKWKAMAFTTTGAFFVALSAGVLMYHSGGPRYAAYWFGAGLLAFALGMGIHTAFHIQRIYRMKR